MAEELIALASRFSQRMGGGVPVAVCTEPMGPGEEGFSGAKLLRLRCTYADGGEATCIAKHTTWQERAVMQTFTGQGRGFTPAAWDTQETSREDAWLLLEDVSLSQPLPPDTLAWKAQVAQALAALHGDNLSRPGTPALLPPRPRGPLAAGHHSPFPGPPPAPVPAGRGVLPPLRRPSASAVQAGGALCPGDAGPQPGGSHPHRDPRRPANHLRGPRAPLPG